MSLVMRRVRTFGALPLLALVVFAALSLLVLLARPASASLNSSPDETWVTDNKVYSVVSAGDRVYLGGDFTYVGPNVGYGATLDTTNGQRDTKFPKINGKVFAAISDGAGGWFVGGDFTRVGSSNRTRLAHIRASGEVANWNPKANSTVNALALSPDGSRLYAGGEFTGVGGVARNRLAAINTVSGGIDSGWDANANSTVNALALSPDGSRLYAGGGFTGVGGVARNRLAAIDAATGAVDSGWDANANNTVNALSIGGGRLYAGGGFTSVGGVARNRLAAIDAATGAVDPKWNPDADGVVRALALSPDGSRLYAGGEFTGVGGVARNRLAAIDAATGAVDPKWKANANYTVYALAVSGRRLYIGGGFTNVKGQSRNRLALVDGLTGDLDPNWVPAADDTVWALESSVDGSRVYAGGRFTQISGTSVQRLARLDATTGALDTSWRPNPSYGILDLAVSNSRVYIAGAGAGGNLAAFDATKPLTTGNYTWRLKGDGDVQVVVVRGDKVYAGGHFGVLDGQTRNYLAAADASTGALDPQWAPVAPGGQGIWAMTGSSGPRLYVGGEFTRISGQVQQGYAQFSDSDVTAPTVLGVTPEDGSTDVAVTTNAEASLSEAMDGSTISGATFTLNKEGSVEPIQATISYDAAAKKAILNPTENLTSGTYKATIKGGVNGAKDVAGTPLGADQVWSFSTPDTEPPETSLDSAPLGTISSMSAEFTFSSSEADSTFECSLDGALFQSCDSPMQYTDLADGDHTFEVKAKDAAGNIDPSPAKSDWTIDTIAPNAPVITSPPDGASLANGDFTLSGTAEPGSTVNIFGDVISVGKTQADARGAWSKTLSSVPDGSHTYTVTAADAAGNVSATSNTLTVVVEAPRPSAPSGLTAIASSDSQVNLSWTDNATNESAYVVERSPDGSTGWTQLTSMLPADTSSYSDINLTADGFYYYRVKAINSGRSSDYSNTANATTFLFSEAWTGTDGSAWNKLKWITDGGTSATLDIQSNQGRLQFADVLNARARAIAATPKRADTELLTSFRFTSTEAKGVLQIFLRASGDWKSGGYPNSAYYVEIPNNSRSIGLRKVSAGTISQLSTASIGQATTAKQWLRFRIEGSSLKAKVWMEGTQEPENWEMQVTDTAFPDPGVLQLRWSRSSTATGAREVYLDDLSTTDVGP